MECWGVLESLENMGFGVSFWRLRSGGVWIELEVFSGGVGAWVVIACL